jgi:hypothetical protein
VSALDDVSSSSTAGAAPSRYPWYELQSLTSTVRWIVAAWSLFAVAMAVALALGWKLRSGVLIDLVITMAEPPALVVLGGLGIVSSIVYLVWIYRASANLWSLPDVRERMRPGWAVGGYFIPLANRVMPYLGMRNLTAPVHGGAGWWWALVLVGEGCFRAGDRIGERATTAGGVEAALLLLVLGWLLQAFAGLRLFKIVGEVTQWQAEELGRLARRDEPAPIASPLVRM